MFSLPSLGSDLTSLRPFAVVRLIVLDIDGTLPSATTGQIGSIVGGYRSSLAHYRRGVQITVATGRTFAAANQVLIDLRLPASTMVILYNGAITTTAAGDRVLGRSLLADSAVSTLMQLGQSLKARTYVFSCESKFTSESGAHKASIVESVLGVSPVTINPSQFGGLDVMWTAQVSSPPTEVAAVLFEAPDAALRNGLLDHLSTMNLSVSMSSPKYLEVSAPETTKAEALMRLAERLGLKPEEVAAVGDNENDVEMLRWAGVGIAVANASPAALAASDYVTHFSAGDGVVEVLRLIRSATRYRALIRKG